MEKRTTLKYVFILFLFHLAFSPSANYVFSENSADTFTRWIVIPSLLESTVIKSDCHRTTVVLLRF